MHLRNNAVFVLARASSAGAACLIPLFIASAAPVAGGTFAIIGAQPGSWPSVLSSAGHVSGPPASADIFVAPPGTPAAAGFDAIAAVDASFAPDSFLSGARTAYEMIVGAFAAGDLPTLRRLLAPEVLANFEKAIRDRVAAEQTMTTTLVSIDAANIIEARLAGMVASVAVRFAAKLASVTRDKAGVAIEGSPNDVVDHLDVWTFTRDVAAGDPNWLLAATQTVN